LLGAGEAFEKNDGARRQEDMVSPPRLLVGTAQHGGRRRFQRLGIGKDLQHD
jgi:hypothetical protein